MGVVILVRARQVVGVQLATEQHEAELSGQLVHAAKLASVGELAAGIAHEINNPLAIIAEEVGVLKDSMDPELTSEDDEPVDVAEHLGAIHDAVFRCRDITRKLLTFVRHAEVKVELHDVHDILDEVLDVLLGNELAISNVVVERRYDREHRRRSSPTGTSSCQVFVNLVKNALDAMAGGRPPHRDHPAQERAGGRLHPGHGVRHEPRAAREDLHALLHHQGPGQGNRPGAERQLHHHPGLRRGVLRRERARQGQHLHREAPPVHSV